MNILQYSLYNPTPKIDTEKQVWEDLTLNFLFLGSTFNPILCVGKNTFS